MKIKNIINPRSISGTGFISVLVTIFIIAPTLGSLWIFSEITGKKKELAEQQEQYTGFYKTVLSNDVKNVVNFIGYKRSNTENRVKEIVKGRVHQAYSLASHIYDMERDQIRTSQLKTRIIETLRPIRWDNGKGYFFIINSGGYMLLNSSLPSMENKNTFDLKDTDGRLITRDILALAKRNDSGFYRYRWTKPGASGAGHVKITYVKNFKPFNWVICAGFYIDDMEASIKNEILERISKLTNDKDEYIFVLNHDGFCLYHPIEKFHRKNIINHRAEDGRLVIKELIEASHEKGGHFIQYPWEKPSTGKIEDKLSFAISIKDWDWTIGKGVYLGQIQHFLAHEKAKFKSELIRKIFIIAGVSVLIILFSLALGIMITNRLHKGINAFTDFFKKAADQDIKINTEQLTFKEFKLLGTLANQMVDDRVQKEYALRDAMHETVELQKLLENITDSMPSSLIAIDQGMKVIHWNLKVAQSTGIRSGEAEGRAIHEVFPLSDREIKLINEAFETGYSSTLSRVTRENSTEKTHEEMIIYPLTTNNMKGAVIRIDDTTEKVRIEEMMIQSEKMMSVGGLAAGMAHEINNPLSGILGNIDVIENRLIRNLPINQKTAHELHTNFEIVQGYVAKRGIPDLIDNIRQAGSRAAKIVSDMLSFSRMSASNFAECNIADLLEKTIDIVSTSYDLKKKFDFKKIKIIKHFAENMPPVTCESSKLQQVFLNILSNGAYAMSDNPENRPPTFILSLDHDKNKKKAVIKIADNGPGIEQERLKRIFEPFFTTKEVGIGTGLGLSVSYFIITDQHKGTLEVESEPGEGTAFIIQIPLSPT